MECVLRIFLIFDAFRPRDLVLETAGAVHKFERSVANQP